jgi:hypothetical protein
MLSDHIVEMMHEVLGLPCEMIDWEHVRHGAGCAHAPIAMYEDTRPEFIDRVLAECPNMRAVHLTREAFSITASTYVYIRNLKPGEDVPSDVARGALLRSMSLEEGVKDVCHRDANGYMPQLGDSSKYISELNVPNIVQIRYEDWMHDFDNVSRTIFSHFLGEDHPAIDELVQRAAVFDLSRQPPSEVEDNRHVTSHDEKADATRVLQTLYEGHDFCTERLVFVDKEMQYPLPDFVLNSSSAL